MPESHLRAGDTDRTAVATVLGRHMAEGRLTVAEYDERVARAYAARTYGELAELTADLPTTDDARSATPAPRPQAAPGHGCGGMAGRSHDAGAAWAAWRRIAVIVVGIWAITSVLAGGVIYFWPLWVIGPWGAVLLAQTLNGRSHGRPAHRSHPAG